VKGQIIFVHLVHEKADECIYYNYIFSKSTQINSVFILFFYFLFFKKFTSK
jgi:hypothetical protein